jgi:hypothetical protein
VTPSQIEEWYPNASENRRTTMRREQRMHRREYKRWSGLARFAYNAGLISLGLGFIAALAPRDFTTGRIVAVVLASAAVSAECFWLVQSLYRTGARDLPEVGPELK